MKKLPDRSQDDEQSEDLATVAFFLVASIAGLWFIGSLYNGRPCNWHPGAYVPAYLRRYPFIVTQTQDKARQFLGIDRESNRFVASASTYQNAARLFDGEGRPTLTAQSAMAFYRAYHTGYAATVAFGQALLAAKVLSHYHAEFRLPDGTLHQVNGFYAVDEQAFRALPAKTVADWHARGWLALVALHHVSLQSFQNLLDLNAQRATERKALA